MSITTEPRPASIRSRLFWFVLIWALSVLSVSVVAFLLRWLIRWSP